MNKLGKVVIAAAAGVAAGMLLAPKSGKETRADLKNKLQDAKSMTKAKADKLKTVADRANKSANETVGRAKKEADQMMESAKRSGKVVTNEAMKLRDEGEVRARRTLADAKRTATGVKKDAEESLK